jgi:hypothetical protein
MYVIENNLYPNELLYRSRSSTNKMLNVEMLYKELSVEIDLSRLSTHPNLDNCLPIFWLQQTLR